MARDPPALGPHGGDDATGERGGVVQRKPLAQPVIHPPLPGISRVDSREEQRPSSCEQRDRCDESLRTPEQISALVDEICGEGAPPGRFHGVPAPRVVRTAGVPGVSTEATLHVPASAPFFGDHFPRRPVFPATLLLDAQIRLALDVAAEATFWPAGTRPAPSRMTHVKMRSFIPPGAILDIGVELTPADAGSANVRLSARMDGKVAATARLELSAQENKR